MLPSANALFEIDLFAMCLFHKASPSSRGDVISLKACGKLSFPNKLYLKVWPKSIGTVDFAGFSFKSFFWLYYGLKNSNAIRSYLLNQFIAIT